MTTNLLGGVIDGMFEFLKNFFNGFSYDIIFGATVGLMAVAIVIAFIRIRFSFERSAVKSIKKMNKYLLGIININEDNLVTFHKHLQRMPKKIRERWQLYILERDGLPSRYLTAEYCIRRPLAGSVMQSLQKQIKFTSVILSVIAFILGFTFVLNGGADAPTIVKNIVMYCLATPLIIFLLAVCCCMIIQHTYSSANSKIYDEFEKFVRSLNKAVATLPDSIDYQVLFSQKEIEEGIPVLREYLEKQKLEEQQMLEQSKYTALSHSPYNFQELGVDGEQLITRAVDESENFLMKKIGLQNEIQEYEQKLAQSQQNMDEIEKEANRKLQTIKENIERLNKAISETTNRVEINYNNRQIKDEMEKRAAVEKDLKSLLSKEQVVMNECNVEIQKRKDMIEQDKSRVEVALKSEYNTFAVKVYDTLSNKLTEENEDVIKDYQNQILNANVKIKNLSREMEEKDSVIAQKDLIISNLKGGQPQPAAAPVQPAEVVQQAPAPEPVPEVVSQPEPAPAAENLISEQTVQDQDQVFYDESGSAIDYSQYFDENGNFIGGDFSEAQVVEAPVDTAPAEGEVNVVTEAPAQVVEGAVAPEQPVQTEEIPAAENAEMPAESVETAVEEQTEKPAEIAAQTAEVVVPVEEPKPAKTTKKSSTAKKTASKTAQKKAAVKTTSKKKGATIKVSEESLKSANNEDDLNEIQKQIDKEQEKLQQNQDALQEQINEALNKAEQSSTKTSKATGIKKIKELIEQLKEKAKQAKANGGSKEEIKQINASVAELVEALTKLSKK